MHLKVFMTGKKTTFCVWASMVKLAEDLQPKQRIYSSYNSDFRSFTEQFVYLETEKHVIDVDIVREKGGRDN